jgi:hypothetical protein
LQLANYRGFIYPFENIKKVLFSNKQPQATIFAMDCHTDAASICHHIKLAMLAAWQNSSTPIVG